MPPDVPVDEIPVEDPTAFVLGGSRGLRRRAQGARGNWLGIGIVGLAVAIPLRGLFVTTGGTMEEGFMLYFPERMWDGDVPNVDFLHLYGPGALHVLMGWFKVFGFTLGAERTFGLLQHLGIIFGLYALARAWGRAAATAVATLSTLLILTPIGLTAMAWNGGLALTLWSAVFGVRAVYLSEPAARRNAWVISGVLAGLALTYRPDLVIAVGLVMAWLLWHHRAARRPVLVGALVGAIPMWVHVAIAGPRAAFEGMFVDPVFNLRGGRELPRPPSWDRLDGALQAIAEQVPPWWRVPHFSASASLFLWFWAMLLITAGLVVLAAWLSRRSGHAPRIDGPHGRFPRRHRHRAAGDATARLDAPGVGDVHLVAAGGRRHRRARPPATADVASPSPAHDRRVARRRADAGRGAAVHVPLLPELGAGVGRRPPRERFPSSATGGGSTSATPGRGGRAGT